MANQQRPQEIQQRREESAARQAYAEQERRNQELQRREEEEREADQQRTYEEYSEAAEDVNESKEKLEQSADRYNTLIDLFNSAKTNEDLVRLRGELEQARNEYNNSSLEFAAASQRYNQTAEAAKIAGSISPDVKLISYTHESLKSPFEMTEAELEASQKEEKERQTIMSQVENKGEEYNITADLLEQKAGEYNLLVTRYNLAANSNERDLLQPQIQSAATELNSISLLLQKTGEEYNSALRAAKSKGIVNEEAAYADYVAQEVDPIFFRDSTTEVYIPDELKGAAKEVTAGNYKIIGTEHPEYGELLTAGNSEEISGNTISYSDKMLNLADDVSKTGNPIEKAAANYYLWQNDDSAVGSAAWYEKNVSNAFGKDITQKVDTGQTQRDNRDNLIAGALYAPAQTARILSAGAFASVFAARGISEGKGADVLPVIGAGAAAAVAGTVEYAKDNPWGFAGSLAANAALGKAAGGVLKTVKNTHVSVSIPKTEKTTIPGITANGLETVTQTRKAGVINFDLYNFGVEIKGKLQKVETPSAADINTGFIIKAGNRQTNKVFLEYAVEKKQGVMRKVEDLPTGSQEVQGSYSMKQSAFEISSNDGSLLRKAKDVRQREAAISSESGAYEIRSGDFIREEVSGLKSEKGSRSLIGVGKRENEYVREKAEITHIEDITRKQTITRKNNSVDVFETHDSRKSTSTQPRDFPAESFEGFTKEAGGSEANAGGGMVILEKPSVKSEGKTQAQNIQIETPGFELKPAAAEKTASKKKSAAVLITPVSQRTTFTQTKPSDGGLVFASPADAVKTTNIHQSQIYQNKPVASGKVSSTAATLMKLKHDLTDISTSKEAATEARKDKDKLIIYPLSRPRRMTQQKQTPLQGIQYITPRNSKKTKIKTKAKQNKNTGKKKDILGLNVRSVLVEHKLNTRLF